GFDSLPRSLLPGPAGMGATGAHRAKRRRGPATAAPHLETLLWRVGIRHVAGVDEVGMGPLAGPVVAAAVVFPPGTRLDGVADSKVLTAAQRERLDVEIRRRAVGVGLGVVEPDEIDRLNILRAGAGRRARRGGSTARAGSGARCGLTPAALFLAPRTPIIDHIPWTRPCSSTSTARCASPGASRRPRRRPTRRGR